MEVEKIKESAKNFFAAHKKQQVVIATTDGNLFFEENKSYANTHAKSNQLEVIFFDRESICNDAGSLPDLLEMGKEKLIDFALTNNIEVEQDWTEEEMIAEITKELKED